MNPTCFQGNTLLQHSLSPGTLRYIWMGQDCLKLSSVSLNPFICNLGQIFENETPKERVWFWIPSITLGSCYEVILQGSSVLAWFHVLWLFHYSIFPAIVFSFSTWSRAELELGPDLLISLEAAGQKKKDNPPSPCDSRTVNSNLGQLRSASARVPVWQ